MSKHLRAIGFALLGLCAALPAWAGCPAGTTCTTLPGFSAAGVMADTDLIPVNQSGSSTVKQTGTAMWTWIGTHLTAPGPVGSVTPSTGAFTTLSASGAVSGAGVTARFATPGPIGNTVASTGAFTTLSASSTVSGAGITALFASPPSIGSTARGTGAFTTLSATGAMSFSGLSAGTQVSCIGLDVSNNVVLNAAACGSGSGGGSPGGSTTQVQFNSAGSFGGSANLTWVSPKLTIGVATSTTGQLALTGATSGTITIAGQAAAGTYNLNLPTTAGTSGQPLLSGGGGATAMSFGTLSAAGGGTGNATNTAHAVMLGEGTSAISFANIGTAGRLLIDQGAGADPAFTAMSGDVTINGSGVSAIGANKVTFSQLQQVTASSLIGNSTGSTANAQAIALGGGLTFCGTASLCPTAPDNTSVANYTIAAADMAGQRNMSGTSLTLTIPAISSTVLAQGMSTLFADYDTTALTISTTPLLNGLPNAGATLHQYGWANCVSNSTSLDCVGFPGFGTITTNALPKFIDAGGATTASSIVDNGTIVRTSEPVSAETASFVTEVANEGSTGTTVSRLVKMTGAPQKAIIASTSDTEGIVGIVFGGAGTTGSAQIAIRGQATCDFDSGGVTAGHYVIISNVTAGKCKDSGVAAGSGSVPTATETIGIAQATVGASSSGLVNIATGYTNTAGGGSGTVNAGTAGQMAYYASSTTAVSGNASANISGGALTLGQVGSVAGSLILNGSGSGAITLVGQAASGTYNFNFPTAAGTSGQPLLSGGGGATAMSFGTLGVAAGGTGLTSGTSGGVLAFTASGTLASSGALTANAIVLGGGAGAAPTILGSLGTTTTVLHGNASGAPTFGAIVAADITSATITGTQIASSIALAGSPTTTTQSAKDNSTKVATTAYVDAATGLTAGTSVTLVGPRQYFVCTSTCTVTPPVPAAGYEFCVMNGDNVSTVITLAAIGSSARYENTARTAYGTAGTGTFVSGGAAADKVCLLGLDSTHYVTPSFNGTWVAN